MHKLITTGTLGLAGLVTTALVAWQAPTAFADHGRDDGVQSSSSAHRHGNDDGPNHDAGDDHGRHGHGNDDGPNHDAGDDHGRHGGHHRGHHDG
jgi:hypothetical protein